MHNKIVKYYVNNERIVDIENSLENNETELFEKLKEIDTIDCNDKIKQIEDFYKNKFSEIQDWYNDNLEQINITFNIDSIIESERLRIYEEIDFSVKELKDYVTTIQEMYKDIEPNINKLIDVENIPINTMTYNQDELFELISNLEQDIKKISNMKNIESNSLFNKIDGIIGLPIKLVNRITTDETVNILSRLIYIAFLVSIVVGNLNILVPLLTFSGTAITGLNIKNSVKIDSYTEIISNIKNIDKLYDNYYNTLVKEKSKEPLEKLNQKKQLNENKKKTKVAELDRIYNSKVQEFESKSKENEMKQTALKKLEEYKESLKSKAYVDKENSDKILNEEIATLETENTNLLDTIKQMKTEIDNNRFIVKDGYKPDLNMYLVEHKDIVMNLDIYQNVKLKNCILIQHDDTTENLAINVLEQIILKYRSTIKADLFRMKIVDTMYHGGTLKEIIDVDNDEIIKEDNDIGTLIDDTKILASERYINILRDYKDIYDFNKDKDSKGARLEPLVLNVLAKYPATALMQDLGYMLSQDNVGIHTIVLINTKYLADKNISEKVSQLKALKDVTAIDCNEIVISNNQIEPKSTFSVLEPKLLMEKGIELIDRFKNAKLKSIDPDDYTNSIFKKRWYDTTINSVILNFGYLDGDLTQPYEIELEGSSSHVLVAGASGRGKSVVINTILRNMFTRYSPDELNVYHLDFKKVEANLYLEPYRSVHHACIGSTDDMDYTQSCFEFLYDEMLKREHLLKEHQVNSFKLLRQKGIQAPTIIFLIDEFQDMFTRDEDKKPYFINKIKSMSKKMRALGMKLMFASQSMDGTVSDDILDQFGTRICVGCSTTVSKSMLNNDAAAYLPKYGFSIVNQDIEQGRKTNKIINVPFTNTKHIESTLSKNLEFIKTTDIKPPNLVPYDETVVEPISKLRSKLYAIQNFEKRDEILIGESGLYTTNIVPTYFKFKKLEREHMYVCSKTNENLLHALSTFMTNTDMKLNTQVVMFDNDTTTCDLLDFREQFTLRGYTQVTSVDVFMQTLHGSLKNRIENPDNPMPKTYVIYHRLDKCIELLEGDTTFMGDLNRILMECSKYNIHVIVTSTNTKRQSKILPFMNYRLVYRVDDGDSTDICNKSRLKDLKDNYAVLFNDSADKESKVKAYISKLNVVEEEELILDIENLN